VVVCHGFKVVFVFRTRAFLYSMNSFTLICFMKSGFSVRSGASAILLQITQEVFLASTFPQLARTSGPVLPPPNIPNLPWPIMFQQSYIAFAVISSIFSIDSVSVPEIEGDSDSSPIKAGQSFPSFVRQSFSVVHFRGISLWASSGAVALVKTESLQTSSCDVSGMSIITKYAIKITTKPKITRT
jgi:hypothetical protein